MKQSTSTEYQIKSMIRLFGLCDYLKEENTYALMNMIQSSKEFEEFSSIFNSGLKELYENSLKYINQKGLNVVFLWALGELGSF